MKPTLRLYVALSVTLFTSSAFAVPSAENLLQSEASQLVESATLEGVEVAPFKKALLSSEDWQRELLDSGLVTEEAIVISHLFELWKFDPDLVQRPVDRAMATACALEGPGKKYDSAEVIRRFSYFRDKNKFGLLNTMYEKLSVFERRYLARGVQHGGFNSAESMEYHNQEVCLPSEAYTGACWYARWILNNPFGDSIHGPMYYHPFQESWESYAEVVRNVGGVCGSLSNFGAAAALANGVPAVTMGEPGHCAYAVMIKPEKWQPAYSLSWKRGTHTSFYGSSWGWHVYNTTGHQDIAATRKSGDLRRLAAYYLEKGTVLKAREIIRLARKGQPLAWENWDQSARILRESKAADRDWQDLHQDVLEHLAPVAGEIAFHFLRHQVYPEVLPKDQDESDRRAKIFLAFQKSMTDWGVGRWDYGSALDYQLKTLSSDITEQDEFAIQVFGAQAETNVFTPDILAKQLGRIGEDEKRFEGFIAGISRTLSKGKGEGFSEVINTLAKTVLPEAAKRGDKATFQYVGKLTAKTYEPHTISPKPFAGILLSSGGTFAIQKPGNRWDNPSRHWGVIEEHGGDFHTDANPATATVQLGNYGRLSGVVIVTRGGNVGRLNGAKLEVSTDNQNWTAVHTFEKVQQIQRIDLSDQKIDAGYVRVIHPSQPSLHFHKFLTYGHKKN
ncbi:discoidin domain-containing protein [bacterium]|nr:discoidin domain-containing protein [Akkermansiaceae bacterium]MDB4287269.1 discoidin domain-containing protein [bacterium]MDB4276103.1 discoidin domain-containing protein [Akkermansiaceae bacterium]MDB4306370.1 discoidin domain-containing protein [bacterium]MDB4318573.1 discoidin domain-containing protein [bacterium]